MRASLIVSALVLVAAPLSAQDVDARGGELRERIERIENDRGHEAAEDALAHARRAIAAAERAGHSDAPLVAERALRIADAALVLADRLAARERARHGLADARERKRAAVARAAAAREALERSIVLRDTPE